MHVEEMLIRGKLVHKIVILHINLNMYVSS